MCNSNPISTQIDPQQQIGHTNLTIKWLLDIAGKKCRHFQLLNKASEVVDVSISQIGQKQGHNSTIYLIQVTFLNGQSVDYCLKTPPISDESPLSGLRRGLPPDHKQIAHNRECLFYQEFSGLEGLKLPQIFSLKPMDTEDDKECHILMEYLGHKSTLITLSQSYTRDQLFSIVEQLAYLHAFSHLHRKELESKFTSIRLGFKKDPEHKKAFEEHCLKTLKRLGESGGSNVVALLDKLSERAGRDRSNYYASEKVHIENGVPTFLIHNDLWGNNIMFQTNENGPTSNLEALIDWQFVAYGNISQDLARFLIMNVDADLRRSVTNDLLQFYCQEFHKNLKSIDISFDGKELFGAEQLKITFDASFLSQIHFATFIGTINFSHPNANPKERHAYYERLHSAVEDALKIVDEHEGKWNL